MKRGPSGRWSLHRQLIFGGGLLSVVVLGSLLAPAIAPHDPRAQDLQNRLLVPTWRWNDYFLGSDQLGRDILSRILYGGRITLLVALTAVAITGVVGVFLGLISGYFGGRVDTAIMSIVDIQLALPFVLLGIMAASTLGMGLLNIILVLSLSGWVVFARVVRSVVLSLKTREFVAASRIIGAKDRHVLYRHILPHALTPVIAIATPQVARMILLESALSFLGLSGQPLMPTWGGMLGDAREYIYRAPWMLIFPGVAIMMTVLGVNFVGDWLRHRLDP